MTILAHLGLPPHVVHTHLHSHNGPGHAAELLLADRRQHVVVLHHLGESASRRQSGLGSGIDAHRTAHVDRDVVPRGHIRFDRIGGVPARRHIGIDIIQNNESRTDDGLGDLRIVLDEMGDQGVHPLIDVEGRHRRLRARGMDCHEVSDSRLGQQLARVVLGQREMSRDVHAQSLARTEAVEQRNFTGASHNRPDGGEPISSRIASANQRGIQRTRRPPPGVHE